MRLRSSLEKERFNKDTDQNDIKEFLSREIETYLKKVEEPLLLDNEKKPQVILFTGVNGSGKTTTIGKLSAQMQAQGLKTMMVAGDTFRAAAVEQLKIWGERTNTPVISKDIGADAAGLVYDAYQEAINQDIDVLLIDTAGRLQNKKGLMDELHKISKVLKKYDTNLPHHSILILDATTGQNAFQQVESFRYNAGITGIIVTKLDGSAKGGVLIGIAAEFILPVHGIGIGEKLSDLQRFRATDFTKAILE
jgi:fused signal recognition particle receptor